MKNRICIYPIALKCFSFCDLRVLGVHLVSQQKSLCSSTCGYLGLLASPELRVVLIYFLDFLRFQQHQSLAQSVKGSRYYQTIPPVQVECPLLDGDPTSIPIIFEDKYYFSEPTEPGTCKPLCFGDFMPNFCNSRQTC